MNKTNFEKYINKRDICKDCECDHETCEHRMYYSIMYSGIASILLKLYDADPINVSIDIHGIDILCEHFHYVPKTEE